MKFLLECREDEHLKSNLVGGGPRVRISLCPADLATAQPPRLSCKGRRLHQGRDAQKISMVLKRVFDSD
jgi:hypothetical protein